MNNFGLLALDQGTTSSRAIVFNQSGSIESIAQKELTQYFPASGHVEHDAEEIWAITLETMRGALAQAKSDVKAIGITNQRETVVLWDRLTGKPLHKALVWQDRRTAPICDALKAESKEEFVRAKTGLVLDPYFSATKIAWLLDNIDGARDRADKGELCAGTIDSWLIYKLTGHRVFATDATNASRTNLFNIHECEWDTELLELFKVPRNILPEVKDSVAGFGRTDKQVTGVDLPVCGVAGDQQAAAFGQACFVPGDTKSTYGTGAFVLMNSGENVITPDGLLATIAYQLNGKPTYAVEGSIFMAGAIVQWLRDELGLVKDASETEAIANSIEDTEGVYVVPAFTGLGAPYWDADARGLICGLSRGSGKAHIVRAALESVAYQTDDLLRAMAAGGVAPKALRVDGGMVANSWFTQYLTDTLGIVVDRPEILETTAFGAACLAGLGVGVFSSLEEVAEKHKIERQFTPSKDTNWRDTKRSNWQSAVKRALG